jgi:hypothetical protein
MTKATHDGMSNRVEHENLPQHGQNEEGSPLDALRERACRGEGGRKVRDSVFVCVCVKRAHKFCHATDFGLTVFVGTNLS